jgi:hypothetical protein
LIKAATAGLPMATSVSRACSRVIASPLLRLAMSNEMSAVVSMILCFGVDGAIVDTVDSLNLSFRAASEYPYRMA